MDHDGYGEDGGEEEEQRHEHVNDDYEDLAPEVPPEPEVEHATDRGYDEETQLLVDEADKVTMRVLAIDYRCDNRCSWLSAHNCQVPTPTSQNLEREQHVRIFGAG